MFWGKASNSGYTFILALLLCVTNLSAQSREEAVISPFGGVPYLIVRSDETGQSKKEPGFYVRVAEDANSAEGQDWRKAISGNIFIRPVTGGVSLPLAMGKWTSRYEVIVVANGQIVLANIHADETTGEGLSIFGEGEAQILDPLSGEAIRVPKISSTADFSLHEEEFVDTGLNQKAQLILVSIKADNLPYGDGITFAAVLSADENDESTGSNIKFAYPPVLLDYEFVERSQLRRRFQKVGEYYRLFSKAIIKKFARTRETDSEMMASWKAFLAQFTSGDLDFQAIEAALRTRERSQLDPRKSGSSVGNSKLSPDQIERLPYIYVADGEVNIESLPDSADSLLGVELHSVVNPLDGSAGLYQGDFQFASTDLSYFRPIIHGEAVLHSKNLQGGEQGSGGAEDLAVIHMTDGRVMLLAKDYTQSELRSVQLPFPERKLSGLELTNFAWHYNVESRILIASWQFGDRSVTSAYLLDFSKPSLSVEATVNLGEKFYDRKQLRWRTLVHEGELGFDHLTELVDTEEDYRDRHRITALHFHLNRSLRPLSRDEVALRTFFPKPLSNQRIDRDLHYREYEMADSAETKTGLYLKEDSDAQVPEKFIKGMNPKKGSFKSLVIAEETLDSGLDAFGDIKVRAIPLDTNFTEGRNSTIHVTFTPQEKNKSSGHVGIFKRPFDIERLTQFGFIDPVQFNEGKERKKSVGQGRGTGRLIAFATVKGQGDEEGATYIFQIDYRRVDSTIEITESTELRVETTALTEQEIRSRVLVDDQNRSFWVQTPERDRVDDRFQVIRIQDAETIRPHRSRDIRLQSPEEVSGKKKTEYERNTWRVDDGLRSGSQEERDERQRLRQASEFQTDVFPRLKELMDDLADIERAPRHVALIVPDDLLQYVKDYIWALRFRDQGRMPHWNPANQKHVAFSLRGNVDPESLTQEDVMMNIARMNDVGAGRRAVFASAIEDVIAAGRPEFGDETPQKDKFLLRERTVNDIGSKFDAGAAHQESQTKPPHFMYLMANEGKKTPLSRFDPKQVQKSTSQLFIGSQTEWNYLQAEADFEANYGLFDSVEVVELEPPTRELRIQYAIENVLRMPLIKAFGYTVSLEGMVSAGGHENYERDEAELKLMSYLVNRAQQLAIDNNMPVFESFMRVLNELARQLTQNSQYRRARVVNRGIIEKVLARIFPMPLNLNVLSDSDPLKILNREDADFLWLKAGYPGSVHFKDKVIKVILSQLSTDDVRTMKSSAIIMGNTGSTKTRAITTLFKMLGLKHYEFDRGEKDNEGSWAFVLNMAQVLSPKGGSKQVGSERMMSFEDAKNHLDTFLASENGARGFIFFDDMHLAPDDVRAYFLRRIRALQDDRVYRTIRGDERPTRNISLFVAINPTEDKGKIKKFAKKEYSPSEAEVILATLSTDDYVLDHSFLARWGDVINLSYFPASSKAPALLDVLEPARRANFANTQRLVFISPEVIERTIANSPRTDARTFLSTVTSKLMSLPSGQDNHLYIIVPKPPELFVEESTPGEVDPHFQSSNIDGMEEASSIEEFIEMNFYAIGIDDSYKGQIEFLRLVVQNFRLKVFELILQAVSENRDFMRREEFKQQLVLPLSQAIHRHLGEFPEPYIKDLVLDAREFGARTTANRSGFYEAYSALIEDQARRLGKQGAPVIVGEVPRENALAGFGIGSRSPRNSRQHVLSETVSEFSQILDRFLMSTLNMSELGSPDQPEAWLDQEFPEVFPAQVFGEELGQGISIYIQRLFDPVVEQTATQPMNQYDAMRLFCFAIDRAIARLPWARISRTMVNGLLRTSEDMSLGQSPHVQELLFRNQRSIFYPVDDGVVLGRARSMPYFEDHQRDEAEQHKKFEKSCADFLKSAVN